MSEDCLFCKIISGDVPSNKVYSDAEVYAFHDISPAAPTHILIIPRKHLTSIAHANEQDEALLGHLLLKANEIAEAQGLGDEGFRYIINTGDRGGQTVHHLHLHILGGRQMTWPPG